MWSHGDRRRLGLVLRLRDDERGVGLVLAVSVMAVVFILGASWTRMATHQVDRSAVDRNREQAIHAADAGLHDAIGRLSQDRTVTSIPLTSLDQGGDVFGKYEVTIESPDPLNPDIRLIRSAGYGPNETAHNKSVRTLELEVELLDQSQFDFALFAGETVGAGWSGTSNLELDAPVTVNGDVFASGYARWDASSVINGSVYTWGGIESRGTVQGTLHSVGFLPSGTCPDGDCTVWVRSGTVQQDVMASDDPSTGTVEGAVQIWASSASPDPDPRVVDEVVTAGAVATSTSQSPAYGALVGLDPLPPPQYLLPDFDWSDHTSATGCNPVTHASVSDFKEYFEDNYDSPGISGCHEVTPSSSGDTVRLGGKVQGTTIEAWNLADDFTLYTNRPVKIEADVNNPSGTDKQIVIVSTYPDDNAVKFEGDITSPSSVEILVFAPNGRVLADTGTQDLQGSIYAREVRILSDFTIGEGTDVVDTPGFDWPGVNYVPVRTLLFREVPSSP